MAGKKKVYYLGFYNDSAATKQDRVMWLSAVSKMNYIIDVAVRLGYDVEILSLSPSSTIKGYDAGYFNLAPGVGLRLFKTLSRRTKLTRAYNIFCIQRSVYNYLRQLTSSDVVLCYHNMQMCNLLRRAKQNAGFKLILEVEELYSDVSGDANQRKQELDTFRYADAFVFPTELLNHSVNPDGKPFALCSGVYRANERIAKQRDDGKIHLVYAGTLEPRKGAAAAIAAAALLDDHYVLHVLGGGRSEWVDDIRDAIIDASEMSAGCKIIYEGIKSGKEFDAFIQSCHIGLSPQNVDAEFNATSFPSKVFMYLSNGLSVVSVDLPVFTAEMRSALTLCADNSPKSLSEAVEKTANCKKSNFLNDFDERFGASLQALIN